MKYAVSTLLILAGLILIVASILRYWVSREPQYLCNYR